jgi:preprotein translocase subunit SecG
MSYILTDISSIVFLFVGLLLIFVILLQRGRGGGLAGAFGGVGGQSAFGTKAGDVFTRITIGIAIVWVILAVVTGYAMQYESGQPRYGGGEKAQTQGAGPDGAVEPAAAPGAAKPNPFEAGSEEQNQGSPAKQTSPSKETPKPATTPAQSSEPSSQSQKGAPATKTTPASPTTPSK